MSNKLGILVVEDDPLHIEIMHTILDVDSRLDVHFVDNLRKALDALEYSEQGKINKISVVILDLMLPDSVGLKTLEIMKKQYPLVPIIVLSGAPAELESNILKMGAESFIRKGSNVVQLVPEVLERTFSRHALETKVKEATKEEFTQSQESADRTAVALDKEEAILKTIEEKAKKTTELK